MEHMCSTALAKLLELTTIGVVAERVNNHGCSSSCLCPALRRPAPLQVPGTHRGCAATLIGQQRWWGHTPSRQGKKMAMGHVAWGLALLVATFGNGTGNAAAFFVALFS